LEKPYDFTKLWILIRVFRISKIYHAGKGRNVESEVNGIYEELNEIILKDFKSEQIKLLENLLDKMQTNILSAKQGNRGGKNE